MQPLSKMLSDTFYALNKEYGTRITYTRVGKGDIDSDTGARNTSADISVSLAAIQVPVDIGIEWMVKFLGRVEKLKTVFLIRNPGFVPVTGDFFTHGTTKYRDCQVEDFGGILYGLAGEAFT